MTRLDLPDPETPVTQVIDAHRYLNGDVFQIVLFSSFDDQKLARARAPPRRNGHLHPAGQILTGQGAFVLHDFCQCTLRNDFSTVHTGSGTHIDDVFRCLNGFLIVLDHDDGVARVPQLFEQL